MYIYIYTHTCRDVHVYISRYSCWCLIASVCVCVYISKRVCVWECISKHMYDDDHVKAFARVHMYINQDVHSICVKVCVWVNFDMHLWWLVFVSNVCVCIFWNVFITMCKMCVNMHVHFIVDVQLFITHKSISDMALTIVTLIPESSPLARVQVVLYKLPYLHTMYSYASMSWVSHTHTNVYHFNWTHSQIYVSIDLFSSMLCIYFIILCMNLHWFRKHSNTKYS